MKETYRSCRGRIPVIFKYPIHCTLQCGESCKKTNQILRQKTLVANVVRRRFASTYWTERAHIIYVRIVASTFGITFKIRFSKIVWKHTFDRNGRKKSARKKFFYKRRKIKV